MRQVLRSPHNGGGAQRQGVGHLVSQAQLHAWWPLVPRFRAHHGKARSRQGCTGSCASHVAKRALRRDQAGSRQQGGKGMCEPRVVHTISKCSAMRGSDPPAVARAPRLRGGEEGAQAMEGRADLGVTQVEAEVELADVAALWGRV